jgi:hypothetical protein
MYCFGSESGQEEHLVSHYFHQESFVQYGNSIILYRFGLLPKLCNYHDLYRYSKQCFESGLDPDLIRSMDPDSESGSRRQK